MSSPRCLERATERPPDGLDAKVASGCCSRGAMSESHRIGGRGPRRGRAFLLAAAVLVVVVAAGAIVFAVRHDRGLEVTTGRARATTTIPEPTAGAVARFCAVADELAGERPESYVGSAAQVRDVTRLAERAPITIRTSAEKYRRFLAERRRRSR